MNERAIRWAWRQNLPSTHKLVLLALAHLADAASQCSPGISLLATQCGVSTRTVRRALRDLEADSLLTAQTRLRPDGFATSNKYGLSMTAGHLMSPSPDIHVIGPGHLMTGADGMARYWGPDDTYIYTHESAQQPPFHTTDSERLHSPAPLDRNPTLPTKQSQGPNGAATSIAASQPSTSRRPSPPDGPLPCRLAKSPPLPMGR